MMVNCQQDDTLVNKGSIFNTDPNPGHIFISMSINDGGNTITQTFGFYPSVAVNPLTGNIQCAGQFVNDFSHPYDVSTTAILTNSQFYDVVN